MLTISKPLSASQARTYHQEEFANARENYYTTGDEIRGTWHGQLARVGKLFLMVRARLAGAERLRDGEHGGDLRKRRVRPPTACIRRFSLPGRGAGGERTRRGLQQRGRI